MAGGCHLFCCLQKTFPGSRGSSCVLCAFVFQTSETRCHTSFRACSPHKIKVISIREAVSFFNCRRPVPRNLVGTPAFRDTPVSNSFRSALAGTRLLFLDGAMGTLLQASGLPVGMSPERYCLEKPDVLCSIHKRYLACGADIITTCTFGANPFKLDGGIDLFSFNKTMASVARRAVEESASAAFVAGNLGPSGQFCKPLGTVEPRELIDGYVRQVRGLLAGGVDLFLIETQFDLAEARALVVAVREVTDLPVIVSMTFENGLSLTGSTPEIFVATMENLGVDVIGTNCSLGPDEMLDVVRRMADAGDVPLMAEPNAGLPVLRGSETVFPLDAEAFAAKTALFADLGVRILGGCCGTSPEHIRALSNSLSSFTPKPETRKKKRGITLTSRSRLVRIASDAPLCLIGERINPTGKKVLTEELQHHVFDTALAFADEETALGADVLDVNVGAPLVDETELLPELASLLTGRVQTPLSLDSSNAEALGRALPYCPGSALINSINGEGNRLEELAPLCARFGAPFILLPLTGKNLPETALERRAILEHLLQRLADLGIPRHLVLVDVLALTVSASEESARECLAFLSWLRDEGLPTTLGLSNISFGLPARELVNANFLAMAAGRGLTSCIANPNAVRVREALDAANVLLGHDSRAERFIGGYASWKSGGGGAQKEQIRGSVQTLSDAVLNGDKEHVLDFLRADLDAGKEPFSLVQEVLIPAITEVGRRYERKEYFLPQLLRSAETMQKAFGVLKPLLTEDVRAGDRPVIVMATVEGDIHDIGKNIVSLMLSNHGFEVVDLGKDVPAEKIVDSAAEHKAKLIGLSALMTTTMVKMQETIDLVRSRALPVKVLVGGAAVTQDFADRIGADAYCEDAVVAVRSAKELLG
ncbi:MAG: homocysteine S-methyltransferase family protein [Desulfovibrio sp.]|nr:homocysteine S-methyltransferase family protein [Desulfovibrio sp.]